MASLSFTRLRRPGSSNAGSFGGSKTERHHLDFVVDGVSLFSLTNAAHYDFIGLLGWAPASHDEESVRRLLLELPTELPGDRQPIFVCGECGDIGCGAITAHVALVGDQYIWEDFAYENDYDPEMTDRAPFEGLGPFLFASSQYRHALAQALAARHS